MLKLIIIFNCLNAKWAAGHGGMSGRDNAIEELSEEYSLFLRMRKLNLIVFFG